MGLCFLFVNIYRFWRLIEFILPCVCMRVSSYLHDIMQQHRADTEPQSKVCWNQFISNSQVLRDCAKLMKAETHSLLIGIPSLKCHKIHEDSRTISSWTTVWKHHPETGSSFCEFILSPCPDLKGQSSSFNSSSHHYSFTTLLFSDSNWCWSLKSLSWL